ncbi:hypothetical protein D3C76_1342260 [compost metagenome]
MNVIAWLEAVPRMLPSVSLTEAPNTTEPVKVLLDGKVILGDCRVNFLPLSEVRTENVPWLSPDAFSKRTLPTREARSTVLSNSTSINLSLTGVTLLITGAATSEVTVTVVFVGFGVMTFPT